MPKSKLLGHACRSAMALFAVAAMDATAQAQTSADAPSIVVTGENESGTPVAPPLKTQFSESTITSDAIRNMSDSKSLQTMLDSQPSIFSYETGPNGVGANIFFRAFNSGQFAETYDGASINDIFNGGVTGQASTWNSVLFLPSNVDSVVLNRGINNPSTNSYNSLGGTVNFLPRMPTDKPGATVSASYGSFNSYVLSGSINTGSIGGWKSTLAVDYRKSDGWQIHTPDKNLNIYYAGDYKADNGSELSLIAVYDHNRGSEPFSMPVPLLEKYGKFYQYAYDVDHQTASNNQGMVMLDYKGVMSSAVTFDNKIFGSWQNFSRTSYGNPADSNSPYKLPDQAGTSAYWLYYPTGPSYNPAATFGSTAAGQAYHFYGYSTWTAGYQPKLTVALPHNTVTLGGNLTYGQLNSREYFYGSANMPLEDGYNDAWDEHDSRLLASIYLQDEIRLLNDKLTITPGIKYTYAKTTDNDVVGFYYPYGGEVDDNEHFVAPTIGANYQVNNHLSFNFAYGQNSKLPDITAYYDAMAGSTAAGPTAAHPVKLKPERVNDYELGARYQDGLFNAAVDVYREDFSDVFVDQYNDTTLQTIVSNGGSARYQGVEVQLSDGWKLKRAGTVNAYLNFAYNDAKYTSDFAADSVGTGLSGSDAEVHAGERMADVPNVLLTFGGAWDYKGFRLNAQGRYIGDQVMLNNNTGVPSDYKIPAYFIADIGLSKTLAVAGGHKAKISLNVDNLFNKYYYAEAYVYSSGTFATADGRGTQMAAPGMPRSVSGKIELAF